MSYEPISIRGSHHRFRNRKHQLQQFVDTIPEDLTFF